MNRIKSIVFMIFRSRNAFVFYDFVRENRYFFLIVAFALFLQYIEVIGLYLGNINSTIVNPFIQRIWGWLFLYGICLLTGQRIAKILISLLLILQGILVVSSSFLSLKFSLPLDGDAFFVLAESSPREALEFCSAFLDLKLLLGIFLYLSLLIAAVCLLWKSTLKRKIPLFIIAFLFMLPQLINTVRFSMRGDYDDIYDKNSLSVLIVNLSSFQNENAKLVNMARKPALPVGIQHATPNEKFLAILVIGESATRFHHSIYGYPRSTSPEMERRRNELLVYDDVISGYAHTVQALRYLLTTEEISNKKDLRYSMFDVFKAAGFRVLFYSNQSRWGKYDTPITLMTTHADERCYLQELQSGAYDDLCLKDLQKHTSELKSPTLLVFHLYGSHGSYYKRTPASEKVFHEKNRCPSPYEIDDIAQIDEYDNSIRFTDLLLGKILVKLNELQYPAFFLYVSDHGDCPEKIHRSPRAGSSTLPEVYEIPFILYANPKYREKYPFFMTSAAANQHKSYQTDWAMYAFFSAARITFEQFPYEKDIFSDKFVPPEKRFLGSSNVEYHSRKSPFQAMGKTAENK